MPDINGIRVPFMPVGKTEALNNRYENNLSKTELDGKFDLLFQEELNNVKFSNHAKTRIESRNIILDSEELKKLGETLDLAESKGSRESLIMHKDKAFIVSVPNRTVITVFEKSSSENNVFTNIDSAYFI